MAFFLCLTPARQCFRKSLYTMLVWCPKFCRCHQGTPLQHLVLVAKGFCLQAPQDCNQWGLCSRPHETTTTEETITGRLPTTGHWINKTETHTLIFPEKGTRGRPQVCTHPESCCASHSDPSHGYLCLTSACCYLPGKSFILVWSPNLCY